MTTLLENRSNACPRCGAPYGEHARFGFCSRCVATVSFTETEAAQPSEDELAAVLPRTVAVSGSRSRFGDYELLEEIARGGMGVVYRARQRSLNRIVAVKMLLFGGLAGADRLRRFQKEAAASAALEHANIVRVLDVGEHEGQPFIAMEFIAGTDLAQLVRERPLAARQAAGYVEKIARAIEFAHQRGVLHRDLKPSNVLLDAFDEPRVTDFGLAKQFGVPPSGGSGPAEAGTPSQDLTLTGEALGSPNFMPPEQASGDLRRIGPASDVYGLGAILYHLLTARPPFLGETFEATLVAVREREPVPLGQLNEKVPRDLETICLKCLEKEPEKRYASAQELADELGRFLKDEPIHARPVTRVEQAWRWCRRKPALATAIVLVFVLVLVVGIGSPIAALRINHARRLAELRAYTSDMNVVQQAWEQGNLRRAQSLLQKYLPKPDEPDLRGFEWRYLWKLCQDESRFSFTNFPAEVRISLAPDGSFIAASGGRAIKLLDYVNGRELDTLQLPEGPSAIKALAFHPTDTNVLATVSGKTLCFWNLAGKRITSTLTLSNAAVALAFSRDGKFLAAVGGSDYSVQLWRVDDRSLLWVRQVATAPESLAFVPDGKSLITAGGALCEPLAWDLATGNSTSFASEHRARVRAIEFSPDGRLMATGANDGTVILWDFLERKSLDRLIAQASGTVNDVAFSPDSRWLAAGNADSTIRLWDVAKRQQETLYRGHQSSVFHVAFSPDGRSIISSGWDKAVRVWDLEPRSREDILFRGKEWIRTSVFSPDSRRLAMTEIARGILTVWDVATRSRLAELGTAANGGGGAAFSPDGKTLVQVSGRLIQLWDTTTLTARATWTNDFDSISLAFTPDSRTLAVCGPSSDILDDFTDRLAFWDLTRQRKINKLAAAAPFASVLAFSHDGKKAAIGYVQGEVRVWDYATEQLLAEFTDQRQRIWSVAFSPDDTWLAAGGFEGVVVFHDLRTRRTFRSIRTSMWIVGLCFTPDGKTLASAEADGTIRLWNVATREIALELKGHVGLLSVENSFSPDGKYLATCGADGTVRLWPAAAPDEIPKFKGTK
ncbi:MAG: protein kinase [Verrucomicrobia bacterium]|nr:protein kinase [Verrucomicrobiota bacterium]